MSDSSDKSAYCESVAWERVEAYSQSLGCRLVLKKVVDQHGDSDLFTAKGFNERAGSGRYTRLVHDWGLQTFSAHGHAVHVIFG